MKHKPSVRRQSPSQIERAATGGPPAWAAAIILALAIGAVYGRSLKAPFIFDDVDGIINNASIYSLSPLIGPTGQPGPLNPPQNLPSSGRPLVNLSLAANYYFGRLNPIGYHVFNVSIHFVTALLLWAIVHRTLSLPRFATRFALTAGWLALGVALVWAMHPLQTEAVAYVIQRSELLMALFYLATLYCSLRYFELPLPAREAPGEASASTTSNSTSRMLWLTLAVVACLAGMATKEVMVSAPLIVLLFDRAFVSGSITKALRRSWPLYAGLASTWLLLFALNMNAPRGESAGFGLGQPLISWWLTQSQVLLMYLKLAVWPAPLLIHYRLPYLETFSQAWMYAIPVLLIAVATLVLLWRNYSAGYLLTCVFAILAPTSVVPITTEMAAERRMYLPLAALVVLLVVGVYTAVQSVRRRQSGAGLVWAVPAFVLALALGLLSANRLLAYQDPMRLWREVVQHQPQNALARDNLGKLLSEAGMLPEGIAELQMAVALDPRDQTALANLGQALSESGRFDEAIDKLHDALALAPNDPLALNNLGVALIRAGRYREAIAPLEHAVRARPQFAMAHNSLGGALSAIGQTDDAINQFQQALDLDPDLVLAHENLRLLLEQKGSVKSQPPPQSK